MKNKTENLLPKIEGSVHRQYVRCGKQNCKCARGELHGAYYHFVRVGGRLRKRYLKPHEVEQVQAACAAWREMMMERRDQSRKNQQLIREMNARLRHILKNAHLLVGN